MLSPMQMLANGMVFGTVIIWIVFLLYLVIKKVFRRGK